MLTPRLARLNHYANDAKTLFILFLLHMCWYHYEKSALTSSCCLWDGRQFLWEYCEYCSELKLFVWNVILCLIKSDCLYNETYVIANQSNVSFTWILLLLENSQNLTVLNLNLLWFWSIILSSAHSGYLHTRIHTNHYPSVLWHCWLGQSFIWPVKSSPKWPIMCRWGR